MSKPDHKIRHRFALIARVFFVLAIVLFLARVAFPLCKYRLGSMGATSLGLAFLSAIFGFYISSEPGASRSGEPVIKADNPIDWNFGYFSLVLADVLFVWLIWLAF
jgi:hypothetical protein